MVLYLRLMIAVLLLNSLTIVLAQEVVPTQIDHSDLTYYLDDSGQKQTIKTKEDWAKRREEIIKGMEAAMGPLPDLKTLPPLNIENGDELAGDGFRRLTISFQADQYGPVAADLYFPVPLDEDAKVPGIVALHPTGTQGKRIVAGEGPRPNRQYAVELAQRGYVVIAPDYPSFGDATDYNFGKDHYVSGTMKGIVNHIRSIDVLQQMKQVDGDRIGVIGHSLGGHNAMFLGAFDERVDVVVTSCGWTPFHDYYEGNIKGWTSDRYMPLLRDKYELNPDLVPFDFYEVVAALAPRSFYSSSPKEDSNFAMSGVKKAIPRALGVYSLFDAEEKLKVVYPDCDHDFPTEVREETYQFIDNTLGHEPRNHLNYAAELPRISGKSPQDAMGTFDLVEGYRIEQTAAEPLVTDPVAMSFDENGRLYVVEMKDYSEQDQERLGQVRLLIDHDQDGFFDDSKIFAEDLSWPTAIICSQGGVFVGAAPDIYFLKDTDGDFKADERKVIFTGFQRTNVQGLLNSFRWGLDNRIHGATSSSGGLVKRVGNSSDSGVSLRGRDFSFDPLLLDLRPESGGAQHGMSFDDWGRKFVCSNSDHAQMVMYDDRDIARNPKFKAPGPRIRIADDGGQAPVYRTSPVEPWRIVRTRLRVSKQVRGVVEGGGRAAGYFTGATGITIFRGDAWDEEAKGTVFVGDVGSNIVHRKKLIPRGASFSATRIDENREFLRSSDVWFRPVQFSNAPDGCLHVLDMYRETIEHPKSLPPQIKQHLDLTSGRDRGRLYRVVPAGGLKPRETQLGKLSSSQLVPFLDHTNAWHRNTASRLLIEREAASNANEIEDLVKRATTPQGKIHALSVLLRLDRLTKETLATAISDEHPRVREVAVRLARHHSGVELLSDHLVALKNDADARVRYELAYTTGALPAPQRTEILAAILKQDGHDPWVFIAAMSSLSEGIDRLFEKLLAEQGDVDQTLLTKLFHQLAIQSDEQVVRKQLSAAAEMLSDQPARLADLVRIALQQKPALRAQLKSDELSTVVERVISNAEIIAFDDEASATARAQAISTLKLSRSKENENKLVDLLGTAAPVAVQSAALQTIASQNFTLLNETLIERWNRLSPAFKLEAEELLFGRADGVNAILTALESNEVQASSISPVRLQTLIKSKDTQVAKRAKSLLANSQRPSRLVVIEQYSAALDRSGNPGLGRQVFLKNCATCHRLNGEGTEIGPNLATIQNRGPETILLNVLDPNREVNPKYVNYLALLHSGKTHTGMIADETATSITLMRAEKKTDVLLRSDIEEMTGTGLSIMPEGLEKEITIEMMADLIAYLMSIQ